MKPNCVKALMLIGFDCLNEKNQHIGKTAATPVNIGVAAVSAVLRLVETTGIEPVTSCMSSKYSNQLSYASEVCRTQNIIAQPEKKCNSKNKIYTKFYFMHGRAPACVPPAELMRNQKSKYINGLYEPSAS